MSVEMDAPLRVPLGVTIVLLGAELRGLKSVKLGGVEEVEAEPDPELEADVVLPAV
jgi:hypothetical protein